MTAPLINLRYQILNALGEGGFGKTFLAKDTQMPSQRRCVIKQLKPISDRPEVFDVVRQRFDREAAVLEAVGKGHSQIPDLYAHFEEKGQFYLVQEWIEGQPLSSLASAPWSEDQVRSLLIHMLDALTHVHTSNLIHRDIKPDNIILREADQLPCLIDFGAVKELMNTVAASEEKSSWHIGTPGFMPAEQAIGRPTFSSDLYSLGMTAIYLLSGRSPAQLPTDSHTGEPIWRQFVPNLSEPFAEVLARAVQPVAQKRYFSAADMRTALLNLSAQPASLPTVISSKPTEGTLQPPSPMPQQPELTTRKQVETVVIPAETLTEQQSAGLKSLPLKRLGIAAGALLLGLGVFVGVINGRGLSPELQEAQAALEGGDYDIALTQLDTVLTDSPDNATAWITKGKVQQKQGDYAGAQESFTQAIASNSKSAEAFTLRGNVYDTVGEYDKSMDDYRSALRIDSNYALAYEGIAFIKETEGLTREAIKNLDIAINKDPELDSAYVFRGELKRAINDQAGSVEDWKKAVSITPNTAGDYLMRGKAKSRLNDKEGAMSDWEQALIINPNYEPAHTARAFPFLEQGKVEQALDEVANALAINPNSTSAIAVQAIFASLDPNADPQDTINLYSRSLEINPNSSSVLSGRCNAYTATEQFDLALADCNKALEINPEMSDAYTHRGNLYLKQDEPDLAIQDYTRRIEIAKETGNEAAASGAYSSRSGILVGKGDIEGAFLDVNKAVELSPQTPSYYTSRGMIQSIRGNKDAAREDMQKAADMYLELGQTENRNNVLYVMEQFEL